MAEAAGAGRKQLQPSSELSWFPAFPPACMAWQSSMRKGITMNYRAGHALYRGLAFAARWIFEGLAYSGLAYSGLAYAAPYAAWPAREAENDVDVMPRSPFRPSRPGGPVTLPRLPDERQLVKEVEAYVRREGIRHEVNRPPLRSRSGISRLLQVPWPAQRRCGPTGFSSTGT